MPTRNDIHTSGWRRPESVGRAPHVGKITAVGSVLTQLDSLLILPNRPSAYNQKRVGSCTAQSLALSVEILAPLGGYTAERPDRRHLYGRERRLLGTFYEDSGALISDGVDVLRAGWEPEGAYNDESWNADFLVTPPVLVADSPRLVNAEALAAYSIESIAWEIASSHPVVIGLSITDDWFDGGPKLRKPAGPSVGGHAVTLVGFDIPARCWRVQNSWGLEWGEDGCAWLPWEWTSLPWCGEAFSLRSIRRAD